MKTIQIVATIAVCVPFLYQPSATAQDLTAMQALACEATLCLSTGGPPTECKPSLKKYFSIVFSKPWKTAQARKNFLKLCPDVSESKASKLAADSAETESANDSQGDTGAVASGETKAIVTDDASPAEAIPATGAELPREQIQAALDMLKPAWSLHAKESLEARGVLERCITQQGAAGQCEVERADYDAKRMPAITLRNEVARLESMLAKASQ